MGRLFTEIADIEEIINTSSVCRLGLCEGTQPYVVPLNFAYHEGSLYFHSRRTGKKLDILRTNRSVCVEFDLPGTFEDNENPCRAGFEYSSVIGFGTASFVEGSEEKNRALALITEKYTGRSHTFSQDEIDTVAVVKIEFSELTGKVSD